MNNLIIENTSKQGFWRRFSQGGITLMFWCIWLYFLAPLALPVANAAGIELPVESSDSFGALALRLLSTVLIVIAVLVVWSELWARYNTFLFKQQKQALPLLKVGINALATHYKVRPKELAVWQQRTCLVIDLSDQGDIRSVC